MDENKNLNGLNIGLFGGPVDISLNLVQIILEKKSNELVVLGPSPIIGVGLVCDFIPFILPVVNLPIDLIIPNDLGLEVALSRLDSLFAPEPDNFVFEIKNYFSEFRDFDLSFLDSAGFGFVDRNGNRVPDYVKFNGGCDGACDLSSLYKKSNYKSFK